MPHDHSHDSEHSGSCSHHNGVMKDEKRLFWAMLLTGSFMIVEIIGGVVANSLALLSDAFHMLTDLMSLILAWFAVKIAQKQSDQKRSYGYQRMEVLAAFINGFTMILVVGWICFEAIARLVEPHEVKADVMLVVSIFGLFANLATLKILHSSHEHNLNIKGAIIHVVGDLLSSGAAIIAALIILWQGWMPIDPLLSILVSLLVLKSAIALVKKAGHILLEGVPEDFVLEDIKKGLKEKFATIIDIHHLHIWSLTSQHPLLTSHLVVQKETDQSDLLISVKKALADEFGITHSTIQIEIEGLCPDDDQNNVCSPKSV